MPLLLEFVVVSLRAASFAPDDPSGHPADACYRACEMGPVYQRLRAANP
jgi:hypothetical protein